MKAVWQHAKMNLYQEDLPPVEAAVKALAQIGDERAIPTLQQGLKSTLIRVEAAEALTRFGKTAVSPLVAMYKPKLMTIFDSMSKRRLHVWDGDLGRFGCKKHL